MESDRSGTAASLPVGELMFQSSMSPANARRRPLSLPRRGQHRIPLPASVTSASLAISFSMRRNGIANPLCGKVSHLFLQLNRSSVAPEGSHHCLTQNLSRLTKFLNDVFASVEHNQIHVMPEGPMSVSATHDEESS
jgi:hypothetical protein